jgi:hypothetical protein
VLLLARAVGLELVFAPGGGAIAKPKERAAEAV